MKRLAAILTALVMVLCAAASLAEETESPVLVTVNGQEIREDDAQLQFWIDYIEENSGSVISDEDMAIVKQYAMDYTIEYVLLEQELSKLDPGFADSLKNAETSREPEIKEVWESQIKEIMQQQYGVGEDASEEDKAAGRADAEAYLASYGYTEDSFLAYYCEYFRLAFITDESVKLAGEIPEVTDQDLEDYFNKLVEEDKAKLGDDIAAYEVYTQYYGYSFLYVPEGFRGINHILIKPDDELMNTWKDLESRLEAQNAGGETDGTEAEATPAPDSEPVTQEMVDAAKQAILDSVKDKADEIKAKLAEGASFEDLIVEYGEDPGMQDEEKRTTGYAVHADSILWDPAFTKAAMALEKIGDVSEPFVGQSGVHIVHYLRDIPGGPVEFTDAMKSEYLEELTSERISAAITDVINQVKAVSEITWTEAGEPWKLDPEALQEAAQQEETPAE